MKKIISIFIVLCLICITLTGCQKGWFADEHEFLYNKMSEIAIEDDTYFLEYNKKESIVYAEMNKEQILNGDKVTITCVETEQGVYAVYNVQYKGYNFNIDIKFMEDRSESYVKIHNIWKERIDNYNSKSKIVQFKVFNNKLFIITCGMSTHLAGSVRGEVPYCLYYYDFETDALTYCGFYAGTYDKEFGSYDGFRYEQSLTISVKTS